MQQRWHTRRVASRWRAGGIVILTLAAISGCGQMNSTGRSASYLIVDSLQGARGGGTGSGTFTSTLQSDVLTKGAIYEDSGVATLRAVLKDVTSPTGPTTANSVTVTRYHVSFRRSDGRNTQGVDVPYAFDGGATGTFDSGGGTLGFVLVRAQAKAESPLAELRGTGGAIFIATLADVTFYGQDQNGRQVSVTGTISVNFADWADPT